MLALQDSVDPDQDPDRLQFVLWSRGSEERFTLQASAAFDLEAGDRLFVVTSSPGLLSNKGYLGADLEL